MRKDGKSVDPKNLVDYLNDYVNGLQDRIACLEFDGKPDLELNISNLFKMLDKYQVKFPKIAVALALVETGYFTSRACLECHNLFGLRRPDNGQYHSFDTWEESVKAYSDHVQCKYKGGDYFDFLCRMGYAVDPSYMSLVRQIARSL